MSLADRLTLEADVVCKLAGIIRGMSTEDQNVLQEAFADPRFSAVRITGALRAEGHDVGVSLVKLHRSGGCRCVSA